MNYFRPFRVCLLGATVCLAALAHGQSVLSAPVNAATAGTGTTGMAQGAATAGPLTAAPQLLNGQALPSGMVRPISPDAAATLAMPARPALPPLQRTEFQTLVEESSGQPIRLHGYNLFDGTAFTPAQNVAVPSDYVLGPGDEVMLRVWGAVDADLRLVIDRNGQISIPKAGTFALAGIKAADLNAVMRAQLSRYFNNFQLTASLGQLRSLQIFVVGQARKPGAYTLSSLSTMVSALFESGGPAATGSLRHIQLKRDNKTVATLDLYKFMAEGDKSADIRLLPGDVLVIPPVGPRVALLGSLDTPGIYELSQANEPLGQLLAYSGGTSVLTNPVKLLVERIRANGNQAPRLVQERALDAAGLQAPVQDGDVITLLKLRNEFDNAVTLRGNVAQPLRYAHKSGMRVSDLIPDRQALIDPVYYKRKNALVQFERNSRNLDSRNLDGTLVASDSGRVVDDAQVLNDVKNLFNEINWDYAVVERLEPLALRPTLLSFNLHKAVVERDPAANLLLLPGDVLTVFGVKDIPVPAARRSQFVRIGGEVNAPGLYQITPGETLGQLLQRAGGVSPNAYVYGTVFSRASTRKQQQANLNQAVRRFEAEMSSQTATLLQNSNDLDKASLMAQNQAAQRQMLAKLKTVEASGRISLEINPTKPALPDLPLEDGDQITIPERSGFVSVFGAVLTESSFFQRSSATVRDYLSRAGMTRDADDSSVMVMRADGSVESDTASWFNPIGGIMRRNLYPGDAIFVPEKIDRRTGYVQFMTGAKDWTQLVYQLGIGAAALKTLRQ